MRSLLALACSAGLLCACAGDKASNASTDSAAAAAASASAAPSTATPTVINVTARDFAFDAPDTVTAGMVTLHLVNNGPELHHLQLIRLSDGKTAADLEQGLKTMKPDAPMPPWVHMVAGPNAPAPGENASITEQLDAGNYALICMIPSPDHVPHVMKGMIRALTVVPQTTASTAPAPTADIEVRMSDYAWAVTPDINAGKHVLKLTNDAEQPHEMFLAQLAPGKTPMDLAQWALNPVGPPPGKPLGGISAMSKGESAYMTVDLAPGDYGLLCFLPDSKDGKPHLMHGMVKQFAVK